MGLIIKLTVMLESCIVFEWQSKDTILSKRTNDKELAKFATANHLVVQFTVHFICFCLNLSSG